MTRRVKSSGLTPQERSVMDLYDAGHGLGAISIALDLPRGSVNRIVRMYDAGVTADMAYARQCRISNAAFCAAVAAAGGRFA